MSDIGLIKQLTDANTQAINELAKRGKLFEIISGTYAQGTSIDVTSTGNDFTEFSLIKVASVNGTSNYLAENLASAMVSGNVVYFGDVVLTMTSDTAFTITTVSGALTAVYGVK